MYVNLLITVGELLILFWLAQSFSRHFFRFWFLITTSKGWAMRISSVCFLPGTAVHELSHWLVAEILQVPTGKMDLMPKFQEGSGIRLGSVEIAKTDVFRSTLIGIAPLVTGIALIGVLVSFGDISFDCNGWLCYGRFLGLALCIFLIANTMFSSKKDMQAAFVPIICCLFLVAWWWWNGWELPQQVESWGLEFLSKMNYALLVAIAVHIIFLFILKIVAGLFGRLLGRKVISI